MTIDDLVAHGKALRDEELSIMVIALQKELEDRRNKEQMKMWNKVCDAIDAYVRTYGYFTFINGDEEFTLYRGDYAFGEVGELCINE